MFTPATNHTHSRGRKEDIVKFIFGRQHGVTSQHINHDTLSINFNPIVSIILSLIVTTKSLGALVGGYLKSSCQSSGPPREHRRPPGLPEPSPPPPRGRRTGETPPPTGAGGRAARSAQTRLLVGESREHMLSRRIQNTRQLTKTCGPRHHLVSDADDVEIDTRRDEV